VSRRVYHPVQNSPVEYILDRLFPTTMLLPRDYILRRYEHDQYVPRFFFHENNKNSTSTRVVPVLAPGTLVEVLLVVLVI
jgi:hypothetical protein